MKAVKQPEGQLAAELARFVEQTMQAWQVPGVSLCLVQEGRTLLRRAFGVRDLESGAPADESTLFWIASNTKAVAMLALALLVEEGKLEWDAPLRRYLPGLRMADPLAAEAVSARDLGSHRTGISGAYDRLLGSPELGRRDLLERLPHCRPNRPFRAAYQYNNLMYGLSAHLLEQIAGTSWEQFVSSRILEPLGIEEFDFLHLKPSGHANRSSSYALQQGRVVPFDITSVLRNPPLAAPAGGMNTSIVEMEKWLRLHLDRGECRGRRLISEAALAETYVPQIISNPGSLHPELSHESYALGWAVLYYRGQRLVLHGGALGSLVTFLPGSKTGIAVLTNMATPLSGTVTNRALDLLLGLEPIDWSARYRAEWEAGERQRAEAARKAEEEGSWPPRRIRGASPAHPLAAYCGPYRNPLEGTATVRQRGMELELSLLGVDSRLGHLHYESFLGQIPLGEKLLATFVTGPSGNVEELRISSPFFGSPEEQPPPFRRAGPAPAPTVVV
jgi:CubicO group peptidase (beta-lactamase class C family)